MAQVQMNTLNRWLKGGAKDRKVFIIVLDCAAPEAGVRPLVE